MRGTMMIAPVLAIAIASVACSDGRSGTGQRADFTVTHGDSVALPLYASDGRTVVGEVSATFLPRRNDLMRVRIQASSGFRVSSGYRLADVQVCVIPDTPQFECVDWIGANRHIGPGQHHFFVVDLNGPQMRMCTLRYRVSVRYRAAAADWR